MLRTRIVLISFTLLAPVLALGQAPPATLAFEVATVKPAPPLNPGAIAQGQMPHIGMNIQGSRVDIGFMSLADLIPAAFKVKPYQVSGPDRMRFERFDILAKMPDGATKEQVPEMLQSLLAERFQLKIHRETREGPIYALVVAKGGHKLKESPPDPDAPATEPSPGGLTLPNGAGQIKIDRANGGATVVSPQRSTTRMSMTPDRHMRMEMSKTSDPAGSSIFTSVQQLGLRLEPRKMPLEYIIIDHVEKTPTEN